MDQRLELPDAVITLSDEVKYTESTPVMATGTRTNAPTEFLQMALQQKILKYYMLLYHANS